MNALRAQYFLAFAVMGALLPYLPVYLRDQGLDANQVGWVISMTGASVLLSPVLMALAADLHISNRLLLRGVFVGCGLSLAVMMTLPGAVPGAGAFGLLVVIYMFAWLALSPVTSLQDGLNFAEQDRRMMAGLPQVAYHRVRVFGTLGFIAPSLLLYVLINQGMSTGVAVLTAVGICVIGAANTFLLPRPVVQNETDEKEKAGLPTLAAVKAMLEPHVLVFCVAMWLCQFAVSAYYVFYPIYLTETLAIDAQWVGLISSIGVTIEIVFMLGFGLLLQKLGLRRLMALGVMATAGRFALLWVFPTPAVAIGTQVLHGMMVLVVHVAPPIYLNQRADPAYRNSILGLYVMFVYGTGRLIGIASAGYLAEYSVAAIFGVAAGLCVISSVMFIFAFRDPHHAESAKSRARSNNSCETSGIG